ncbi:MAG: DUF2513 domain-containing protein [Phycisphaerales bacterium]|nr:DUF2513 domain-containing protein [Phycisphaerales bacterium]
MKRDMDLVRLILQKMEEHELGRAPSGMTFEGYTAEQVGYHVLLMGEAGLLLAVESKEIGRKSPSAQPIRLTWAGHEFLDASRSPERWERAKSAAKGVGGLAFDVLKSILITTATEEGSAWLKSHLP